MNSSRSSRRYFLSASAAGLALAGPAIAKGPLVWLDMDQAELDAAYDQSVWAPNQKQVVARYAINSELSRSRIGAPRRAGYGPTAVEALDIHVAKQANAPISIFIHGGAWRGGVAKDWAFIAEMFVNQGVHCVVPDFNAVQDVGGSITAMAEQVRRAVAWVYRNAASFGGDRERIYITGHSSGAHLAGVMLTTDWAALDLPRGILKGGVCLSAPFDLGAVRLSARSNYIKFTDEMEQSMSPPRHLDRLVAPVTVAYASLDSPEFQRQSRDFAAAARAAGKSVRLIVAEGYNHFEAPETFGNPLGVMGRAVLEQMKLV